MRKKEYLERETIEGSGVYCFFPFDSLDTKKKGVFKIGMTGNFDKRVRGYHTYLPQGMYYKCFLRNTHIKTAGLKFGYCFRTTAYATCCEYRGHSKINGFLNGRK